MKNKIFIFILSILLTNCTEKKKTEVKNKKAYDESYIVVFDYYTKNPDYTDSTEVSLNAKEISEVDLILKEAVKDYNDHPERHFVIGNNKREDLKLEEYKRQYSPSINSKGEKEVWVNCIHNHVADDSWKKRKVAGCGGGDYYFQVFINLSKSKFSELTPNGPA